jgi:hypothetical protein
MNFNTWLDTFLEEKGIDLDQIMEIHGEFYGTNFIPVSELINQIKQAPVSEKHGIKDMLVRIDFVNASVMDYLKHLAKAIAI